MLSLLSVSFLASFRADVKRLQRIWSRAEFSALRVGLTSYFFEWLFIVYFFYKCVASDKDPSSCNRRDQGQMNQLIRDAVRSPPKCIPVDGCFQCIKGKMRLGQGRMMNTQNHKLLSCGKEKLPDIFLNISSSLKTVSMRDNHSRMFGSSEHDLRYPCLTYIPNA